MFEPDFFICSQIAGFPGIGRSRVGRGSRAMTIRTLSCHSQTRTPQQAGIAKGATLYPTASEFGMPPPDAAGEPRRNSLGAGNPAISM
jgi:hypothetical protein